MNKKDRQKDQILRHGFSLLRIFRPDTMYDTDRIGPVELCKKVHRLEAQAHRRAEDKCNGVIELSDELSARRDKSTLDRLDKLLNFRTQNIPIFINGDPRGYALKIDDGYVREHNLDIERDWGGYGILAPDFDGN